MRVALATCLELPELDPDQEPLLRALADAGVEAALAAWDDPAVDWQGFDLCVIRSTWNYHRHAEEFLRWVKEVSGMTRLYNPAQVVRPNAHKSYLLDLAENGVRTVPSVLLQQGSKETVAALRARHRFEDLVIKPAISAGSRDTLRVPPGPADAAESHLRRLLAVEDVLVQPYVASIEGYGERCLVWIAGELTHAVRKNPRFVGDRERVEGPFPIADDERELASAALAPFAGDILYGRVDMARDESGRMQLMEMELIEPSLFLVQHPPALQRFVHAIASL